MLVDCEGCGAVVNAEVLKSYDNQQEAFPTVRYTFARCPRCEAPFLLRQEEDLAESNEFELHWEPPMRVYPIAPGPASTRLPIAIRSSFEEARRCFGAKAFTASTIMCRKTLEAICATHGVAERNLATSLQTLRDQGIIESRLFQWADALRISGNEAAHDVALTVPREDAVDIFDFTNALLEYVFTFRDRFDAFQERRRKPAIDSPAT